MKNICSIRSVLKFTSYLAFLTLFTWLTLYNATLSFMSGNTSFVHAMVKQENFTLPYLVLCMPGLKSEKYGYNSINELLNDPEEKYKFLNKTPLEIIKGMSYQLDIDFNVDLVFYPGKLLYHVHKSSNNLGDLEAQQAAMHEIFTTAGLCYLMEITIERSILSSPWFQMKIYSNESMIKGKSQDIQVFVASQNTWQGLYFYSWQYFDVPKLSIPFDKG